MHSRLEFSNLLSYHNLVFYVTHPIGATVTALAVPSPLGPTLPDSLVLCSMYSCSIKWYLQSVMPGPTVSALAVPSSFGPTLPGIVPTMDFVCTRFLTFLLCLREGWLTFFGQRLDGHDPLLLFSVIVRSLISHEFSVTMLQRHWLLSTLLFADTVLILVPHLHGGCKQY